MSRKTKFESCFGPGLLVNLYALMEVEGTRPGMVGVFFSGWAKEATVVGRGGVPWVFFRVPHRGKPDEAYHETEARHVAEREQVLAAKEWVTKKMKVPAILWCTDWGTPRAPDAPPPKGAKVNPQAAYARAVRELKAAIRDRAADIKAQLAELDEQQKIAEAEGSYLDELPGFVGCLDPTTGVVYEAGIAWPQYFQGCGGPGPWNEIVSFHLDLESVDDMLAAADGAVGEAFDMAGVEL